MNSNFRQPKVLFGLAGIFFLTAAVLVGTLVTGARQSINEYAANSGVLSVTPQSQSVHPGDTVTFNINLDTGTSNVTGLDLVLNFDPNALKVDSLETGNGISSFDNVITNSFDNTNGEIIFTAFTLNKNLSVKGSEISVLKINAKAVQTADAGSYNLNFDSQSAVSATNETHSVLTDSIPGTLTIVSQPSATQVVTNAPSEGTPNYCGGTCGSNSNCQTGLTCYQGYCRNPSCSSDVSCECRATTPAPTKKPTTTKVVSSAATPTSVPSEMIPSQPEPTTSSFWQTVFNSATLAPEAIPTLTPVNLPASKNAKLVPWIIGSLILVGLIMVIIAIIVAKNDGKHKSTPPVIHI